jgi:Ca-activated chloride channel homolog
MMLHHPWLLLAALPVLALLWAACRARAGRAMPFSDGRILHRLPVTWGVAVCRARPWLLALAAVALAVALARPRHGLEATRIRTETVDLVLAVDISSSMLAEDFHDGVRRMNRIGAVTRVAREFIGRRPDDRIGLVAFAGVPYTMAPPTWDHAWLLDRLDEINPGLVRDGTAIGDGLAAAVNRLRNSEAPSRVVILLTDGVHNAGTLTPAIAAEAARALGIRIYTIGVGTRGMAPVPVRDPFSGRVRYVEQPVEIDEAVLDRMAEATGGQYARAVDTDSLGAIYRRIDALERGMVEEDRYRQYAETFAPWAAAALALLLLEHLLGLSRWGGLPS